ncbi:hypothetical protein T4B_1821 [Trichinella pseudospiralis]|uniref:Uncharacterized protein n=3 Tax=Trichinella TaxID=6333 RepID=A0A0V1EGW7_TRIPS|nr:hypothetical protein T4A_11204 [Trichinella pseudospiralis]KRY88928.1 hypothetical protein T4D_6114 [Trichinella pseudospiralis]KRZ02896.1 hypothetical protein T11_3935 [Trichinella zimbabwensis]KRZ27559.1 hypothetical protein T4B_1821 [Trichinella pseudospiralis]
MAKQFSTHHQACNGGMSLICEIENEPSLIKLIDARVGLERVN